MGLFIHILTHSIFNLIRCYVRIIVCVLHNGDLQNICWTVYCRVRRVAANGREIAYNIVYSTHSSEINMSLAILYTQTRVDTAAAADTGYTADLFWFEQLIGLVIILKV